MILVETKPSPKGVMRREVAKPLKVKKSKVGSFRLEEVQPSGEKMEAPRAIIARKVKIEKCLFPFDDATRTFCMCLSRCLDGENFLEYQKFDWRLRRNSMIPSTIQQIIMR